MSYARTVDCRVWNDAKFCKLSKPQPNAQTLWFWLLTSVKADTTLPGVLQAGRAGIAEDLDWKLEDLDRCFAELLAAEMVRVDWAHRLVWLPKRIRHVAKNLNPKWVKGWKDPFDGLPECPLKLEIYRAFESTLQSLAEKNPKKRKASLSAFYEHVAVPQTGVPPIALSEALSIALPKEDPAPDPALAPDPDPSSVENERVAEDETELLEEASEESEEGIEKVDSRPPGDLFWEYIQAVRRERGLPPELHKPKATEAVGKRSARPGFDEWAAEVDRQHGYAAFTWGVVRYYEDEAFEHGGWKTTVFMSPEVYPQRCFIPKPKRRLWA